MTVELKPQTERLVREEITPGHVQPVDVVIVQGSTLCVRKPDLHRFHRGSFVVILPTFGRITIRRLGNRSRKTAGFRPHR